MSEENLIVRFSLPRDGSCRVCQTKVRSGTKFNALKTSSLGESRFQFFCKVCKGKFIVSSHPHRAFHLFEGALEESSFQTLEETLDDEFPQTSNKEKEEEIEQEEVTTRFGKNIKDTQRLQRAIKAVRSRRHHLEEAYGIRTSNGTKRNVKPLVRLKVDHQTAEESTSTTAGQSRKKTKPN